MQVYDGKFSAMNCVKLASKLFALPSSWLLLETGNLESKKNSKTSILDDTFLDCQEGIFDYHTNKYLS